MSVQKPQTDWEAVEIHYRAGIRSLKDIGEQYGVSDAGIIKRAKRDGWVRDLAAKIKAKAEAKVSAAAVSKLVSESKRANESAVVEANADLQYRIRIEHRQDIARGRSLFQKLIEEIEAVSANGDLAEQLMEVMTDPNGEDGDEPSKAQQRRMDKMREVFDRVMSMTGRIDSSKKLVEMLDRLVTMERLAYGVDSKKDSGSPQGEINISF